MQKMNSSFSYLLIRTVMPYNLEQILTLYVTFGVFTQILGHFCIQTTSNSSREPIDYNIYVHRKESMTILTVILSLVWSIVVKHQSFISSLLFSLIAYTVYVLILHIILPLCSWAGDLTRTRVKFFQTIFGFYKSNEVEPLCFIIQTGFLSILIFGTLSHLSTSNNISTILLATQAISFLLMVFLFGSMALFTMFSTTSSHSGMLRDFNKKDKPRSDDQANILFKKYNQWQQTVVVLTSPTLLVGKVVYSYKLIAFTAFSPPILTHAYNDQGLELMQFSFGFLVPLMWQLYRSISLYQVVTPPRKTRAEQFFGFLLMINTFANYLKSDGLYSYLGTMISGSAILQIMLLS